MRCGRGGKMGIAGPGRGRYRLVGPIAALGALRPSEAGPPCAKTWWLMLQRRGVRLSPCAAAGACLINQSTTQMKAKAAKACCIYWLGSKGPQSCMYVQADSCRATVHRSDVLICSINYPCAEATVLVKLVHWNVAAYMYPSIRGAPAVVRDHACTLPVKRRRHAACRRSVALYVQVHAGRPDTRLLCTCNLLRVHMARRGRAGWCQRHP